MKFAVLAINLQTLEKKKLNLKIKKYIWLIFRRSNPFIPWILQKKMSDSEYFFFVDFWNHYE